MDINDLIARYPNIAAARAAHHKGEINEETLSLLSIYLDEPAVNETPELSDLDKIIEEYEALKARDPEPQFESFLFEDRYPAQVNRELLDDDEEDLEREQLEWRRKEQKYVRRAKRHFEVACQSWVTRMQALEAQKQVKIANVMREQKTDAARAAIAATIAEQEALRARVREATKIDPRNPADNPQPLQTVTLPMSEYTALRAEVETLRAQIAKYREEENLRMIQQQPKRFFANKNKLNCAVCGTSFIALREHAKYCSPACAQRAHRWRKAEQAGEQQ